MAIHPNGRSDQTCVCCRVLKAAAEATRLRLLMLLAHGEFNVKDLTQILSQSQPRLSRHLKLLADAGLIERFQEGSSVFFRLTENGAAARLARQLLLRSTRTTPSAATGARRDLQARAAGSGPGLFRGARRRLGRNPRAARARSRRRSRHAVGDGRRAVRAAGRPRHRHGPHAGAVRAARPPRRRLRPQPRDARPRAGEARARGADASAAAAWRYLRSSAGELAADAVVIHQVLHFLERAAARRRGGRAAPEAGRAAADRRFRAARAGSPARGLRPSPARLRPGEWASGCERRGLAVRPRAASCRPATTADDKLTVSLWMAVAAGGRRPATDDSARTWSAIGCGQGSGTPQPAAAATATSASPSNSSRRRRTRWRRPWEADPPAGAAEAELRLRHLWRGRLDARAHARDRRAPRARDRAAAGRASDLRRGDPRGGRRGGARLLGGRHPPHRGAARRSARPAWAAPTPASGRLCERGRAGRRHRAHRRLRDLRRRLSREASRIRRRRRRHRDAQGQGRCRRDARHHPVLLRQRPLFPLSRRGARARHRVPIVPGIMPVHNFAQVARFAAHCGATIPAWMARRFDGLDEDPRPPI